MFVLLFCVVLCCLRLPGVGSLSRDMAWVHRAMTRTCFGQVGWLYLLWV